MTKPHLPRSAVAPVATRLNTAHAKLIDAIERAGELPREDAERVADVYLKERIAKLAVTIGQFTLTHGAFLDRDVIRRALDHANGKPLP